MSIHEGHRQRLKERFLRDGLDGFTEVQILELLLFYAVPRRDTNPIAHGLIQRFGNLSRVLDAPVDRLMEVDGITQNGATLLKLAKAMGRSYDVSRSKLETVIRTIDDCGAYLLPFFRNRRNETVFLLCLDAKLKVLDCREIGEGSINYASVPVRRVVETALDLGASSVVLAHNHPSGVAVPSDEDILTTRRVAAALSAVEIALADHIVVADGDYVSMVQSGLRFDDCLVI
jgi:DNA repair protein RadC